jgi:hypothetical protein
VPAIANETIALAYEIAAAEVKAFTEESAGAVIIWLHRWEIWSESIDAVGYAYLTGLAREKALRLGEAPGFLFDSGDFLKCYAALALPMLLQWDAYFMPEHSAFFARVSHEGFIDIVASNPLVAQSLQDRFARYGANTSV